MSDAKSAKLAAVFDGARVCLPPGMCESQQQHTLVQRRLQDHGAVVTPAPHGSASAAAIGPSGCRSLMPHTHRDTTHVLSRAAWAPETLSTHLQHKAVSAAAAVVTLGWVT